MIFNLNLKFFTFMTGDYFAVKGKSKIEHSSIFKHQMFKAQATITVAMMVAHGVDLVSSHGCGAALAHFTREMSDEKLLEGSRPMAMRARASLFVSDVFVNMMAQLEAGRRAGSRTTRRATSGTRWSRSTARSSTRAA